MLQLFSTWMYCTFLDFSGDPALKYVNWSLQVVKVIKQGIKLSRACCHDAITMLK